MTLRPSARATIGGCLAAGALCLGLAGAGAASAAAPSTPAVSVAPTPAATAVPSAPVPSTAPTAGGTDIAVPAGNAGPGSGPAHGTSDWEIAGLVGAAAALLGGAGVAVSRRR